MTTAAQRWRLVLGRYADNRLGAPAGQDHQRIDRVMEYLYGRAYAGRGGRPDGGDGTGRYGSLDPSALTALEWLDELRDLFPAEVCETVEVEAIDRFGLQELLADPDTVDKLEPNYELMRSLMGLRSHLPDSVLVPLRRIIAAVVADLTQRLESEVRSALVGRVNRFRRSHTPQVSTFDAIGTIEANLGTWDPERRQLLVEDLRFFDRSQIRHRWDVIVCIDQSGSMADSVIHSAVLAGILARLPFVRVRLVVFDTNVVDLSHLADDPVEVLMGVQLGGGTNIGQAVRYCEQLVENPTRTVLALITDFYEGGPINELVAATRRLESAQVTQLGLAALDGRTEPAFDRPTAERLAGEGMEIAARTPAQFAVWLSEKIS